MMRRYHRWLSVIVGIFILWIAGTGAIVQFSRMTAPAAPRPPASAPAAALQDADEAPPASASGEAARPAPDATKEFIHFVTELHSGEEFGLAGQLISLLSGLSLLFFAGSGLYMYIQLFRGRLAKIEAGRRVRGGKWFWR